MANKHDKIHPHKEKPEASAYSNTKCQTRKAERNQSIRTRDDKPHKQQPPQFDTVRKVYEPGHRANPPEATKYNSFIKKSQQRRHRQQQQPEKQMEVTTTGTRNKPKRHLQHLHRHLEHPMWLCCHQINPPNTNFPNRKGSTKHQSETTSHHEPGVNKTTDRSLHTTLSKKTKNEAD